MERAAQQVYRGCKVAKKVQEKRDGRTKNTNWNVKSKPFGATNKERRNNDIC